VTIPGEHTFGTGWVMFQAEKQASRSAHGG
jgi:hypothetical protein